MIHLLFMLLALLVTFAVASGAEPGKSPFPAPIQTVLDNTKPLEHPRKDRLPLLLWPVLGGSVDDDKLQEVIIHELDRRGIAMIATWDYDSRKTSLPRALRIARIQKKLGLLVVINANPSMHRFFNGNEKTAHIDIAGKRFFDDSFGPRYKMGCAFAVDFRYPTMTERIDFFVRAYHAAGLPLDLVWGDWEIDGPHEFNRSWDTAKRCVVCRQNIPEIDNFEAYQKAMRVKRGEMTRRCYAEPILSRYPKALVGNYAVYPHGGYRFWYDYFEYFENYHPHILDQRARYRKWFEEFALTGYTFAMPVVYPWHDTFLWYDFEDPDYRWFYNMLLVTSNACKYTDPTIPIISFVHYHTIIVGQELDPSVKQMSKHAYQELLWHMLLRGVDGLFLWSGKKEWGEETRLLHETYVASLAYADWLNHGIPINFDVPRQAGPIVSGLRMGNRVLVRRTDFGKPQPSTVTLHVEGKTLEVPPVTGRCIILELR